MKKSRVEKRREIIAKYVDDNQSDPLVFKDPYGKINASVNPEGTDDVDQLVLNIFDLASKLHSYNPATKKYETCDGCMRSALDVWRHAKSVKPDIDIYTIMESIYRIKDKLYGHFCCTVERAVFNLEDCVDDFAPTKHPRDFICEEYDSYSDDGIVFANWRKLHEDKKETK